MAHSKEVILKNIHDPGVYTHLSFEAFSDVIQELFHQTIFIEEKPFHQALVLVDQTFCFKSVLDDADEYIAIKNDKIQLLYDNLQQIITQEKQFHSEIFSFVKALQHDDLLQSPIAQPQFLNESLKLSKSKRDVSAAFSNLLTGYSLSDLASVAQGNYKRMNSNFRHSKLFAEKLRLTQNKLAHKFGELS